MAPEEEGPGGGHSKCFCDKRVREVRASRKAGKNTANEVKSRNGVITRISRRPLRKHAADLGIFSSAISGVGGKELNEKEKEKARKWMSQCPKVTMCHKKSRLLETALRQGP